MTTATLLTFADVTGGTAWLRTDDVYDPASRTRWRVPALHFSYDCAWPAREGVQIIARGGADIVNVQPFADECDGWGSADCPDAPEHRRPVPVCPVCAPALTRVRP